MVNLFCRINDSSVFEIIYIAGQPLEKRKPVLKEKQTSSENLCDLVVITRERKK
jgi:hypothetical protein